MQNISGQRIPIIGAITPRVTLWIHPRTCSLNLFTLGLWVSHSIKVHDSVRAACSAYAPVRINEKRVTLGHLDPINRNFSNQPPPPL